MKKLTLLILLINLIFSEIAYGNNLTCAKNPIYCRIIKLKPNIDKAWALKLSNIIHGEATKFKMDPFLSVAILMQESSLENINSFHKVETKDSTCDENGCYETIVSRKAVTDMSVAQININTAKHYGFDHEKLFSLDPEYAIQCHFIVLKDKIRLCESLGDEAWTCYHSTTEEFRVRYKELVSRYLP